MTPPGPHAMTAQAGAVAYIDLADTPYGRGWTTSHEPLQMPVGRYLHESAAVPVEALEGLVAKLLNESESNFRRQFGDSDSAGWVYTDLRELFADELTPRLIKERSNG